MSLAAVTPTCRPIASRFRAWLEVRRIRHLIAAHQRTIGFERLNLAEAQARIVAAEKRIAELRVEQALQEIKL